MSIIFPDGTTYKIAADLRARVLDSIEVYGKSRITYNEGGAKTDLTGVPDVWRINPKSTAGKPQGVLMTSDWQHWFYRLNVERMRGQRFTDAEYQAFWRLELKAYKAKTGGETIKDFNSCLRSKASHTNFAGVDKYANYIAQERLGLGLPVFSNIVTGGWVGQYTVNMGFHVISANKDYLQFHPFTHPWLFDEPLSTGRIFKPGTREILRDDVRRSYGRFGNRLVMPVMLPVDDFGVLPDGKIELPSGGEYLSKRYG